MDISEQNLCCPITLQLLRDPVVASDGVTYERQAIEEWIRQDDRSPLTRQPISRNPLYSNQIVKHIIDELKTQVKAKNYQFQLDHDVKKTSNVPFLRTPKKNIYKAEWLQQKRKPCEIILLELRGLYAKTEAAFYVDYARHPHIIRTFGIVYENDTNNRDNEVLLLQEYAPHGSLYDILQDRETSLDEMVLCQIFLQIIDAMIYLSSNNVVHGNLTSRNVLVIRFDENIPEDNLVKLTDFSLSRYNRSLDIESTSKNEINLTTIPTRYAAPEILSADTNVHVYCEKSDIYSMGVLMWEAYAQVAIPWTNIERDEDVRQLVLSGKTLSQPTNCSQPYWSIITRTWSIDPKDRPNFRQLKQYIERQYYYSVSTKHSPITLLQPMSEPFVCISFIFCLYTIAEITRHVFSIENTTKAFNNYDGESNSKKLFSMFLRSCITFILKFTLVAVRYAWFFLFVSISERAVFLQQFPKYNQWYNMIKVRLSAWCMNDRFHHQIILFTLVLSPFIFDVFTQISVTIIEWVLFRLLKLIVCVIRYNWMILFIITDKLLTEVDYFPNINRTYRSFKHSITLRLANIQIIIYLQQVNNAYRNNDKKRLIIFSSILVTPVILDMIVMNFIFILKCLFKYS